MAKIALAVLVSGAVLPGAVLARDRDNRDGNRLVTAA
jgi:hypothetical protein